MLLRQMAIYEPISVRIDLGVHAIAIASGLQLNGPYAAAFVTMFSVSALYNAWPRNRIKRLLWRMDHASIVIFAIVSLSLFKPLPLPISLGCMTYLTGGLFLMWDSLRFHNAIWHCFVIIAAFVHYEAIV